MAFELQILQVNHDYYVSKMYSSRNKTVEKDDDAKPDNLQGISNLANGIHTGFHCFKGTPGLSEEFLLGGMKKFNRRDLLKLAGIAGGCALWPPKTGFAGRDALWSPK